MFSLNSILAGLTTVLVWTYQSVIDEYSECDLGASKQPGDDVTLQDVFEGSTVVPFPLVRFVIWYARSVILHGMNNITSHYMRDLRKTRSTKAMIS